MVTGAFSHFTEVVSRQTPIAAERVIRRGWLLLVIRPVVVLALCLALPLHHRPAAAAEPITWQGKPLTQVSSMSELPKYIRDRFNMEAQPPSGVADIGKYFANGDVSLPGAHNRGLVGAGRSGDTWLLVIAQGHVAGGVSVITYVFEEAELVRQERGGHWAPPDAFAKNIAWLSKPLRPSAQLGGVSVDEPRIQVEARLGKPTEIVTRKPTYIGGSEPPNLPVSSELIYPGLSVQFSPAGKVTEITASGGSHCQTARICVGATAAAVEEELRALEMWDPAWKLNGYTYGVRHESLNCGAEVIYSAELVSRIKLRCTSAGVLPLSPELSWLLR